MWLCILIVVKIVFNVFNVYFPTQICPVGVPGILYIAGRGVAKGYLGDWHKTRYTFLDNFFGDGSIYCTGESSV